MAAVICNSYPIFCVGTAHLLISLNTSKGETAYSGGYDPRKDDDLREVFDYALSKNLAFFDTAELYGFGRSEQLLGDFRKAACTTKADNDKVIIASKFAALPWRTKREDVVKACEASVKRLGQPIDLYQIHFPNACECSIIIRCVAALIICSHHVSNVTCKRL